MANDCVCRQCKKDYSKFDVMRIYGHWVDWVSKYCSAKCYTDATSTPPERSVIVDNLSKLYVDIQKMNDNDIANELKKNGLNNIEKECERIALMMKDVYDRFESMRINESIARFHKEHRN